MAFLNVEIKARCSDPESVRNWLLAHHADFRGTDHQRDTYFQTRQGRLKLREGNIENNLIYYERDNQAGPKSSHFDLVKIPDAGALKAVLEKAVGIKVVVEKSREIYFIGNVKFHIDVVPVLGSFVEIEASNMNAPEKVKGDLETQCSYYLEAFKIKQEDMVEVSYSDMIEDML